MIDSVVSAIRKPTNRSRMLAYTAVYNIVDNKQCTVAFLHAFLKRCMRKLFIESEQRTFKDLSFYFRYFIMTQGGPDNIDSTVNRYVKQTIGQELICKRIELLARIVLHSIESPFRRVPCEILREILLMSLGETSETMHVPIELCKLSTVNKICS